jgi:hypothetical protein
MTAKEIQEYTKTLSRLRIGTVIESIMVKGIWESATQACEH